MLDNQFELLYLIVFIALTIIRTRATMAERRREGHRHTMKIPLKEAVLLALLGVAMLLPLVYIFTPWLSFADYALADWVRWLGLAVAVLAAWLLWRSHADLGQQWSPSVEVQQEHHLVTTGVYKYLRHPMYAAHLLWGIANVLTLPNWLAGWALLVLFVPFYLERVGREERMMFAEFGDEYRLYKARTGGLIPHF